MAPEENPFASPLVASDPADRSGQEGGGLTEAEEIRKKHHGHETSIKSIGFLYYLSAGLCGLLFLGGGGVDMFRIIQGNQVAGVVFAIFLSLGLYAMIGALSLWLGWGLRRLRSKARIGAIVLSVIGLIGFPIGTIINIYFLYLLCSKKGAMVFSPEYQEVIRQTPHMKYKTPVAAWIVLGLLILLVAAAIMGAFVFG